MKAVHHCLDQTVLICLVRMGQGSVKVLDKALDHWIFRLCFQHFFIPGSDIFRHFSLAHKRADDCISGRQVGGNISQDLIKIILGLAKAGSAEKKDLSVF